MAIALHSPKALQRPIRPAWQLVLASPTCHFGLGSWRPVVAGASAWLSSRVRRGLRQHATANSAAPAHEDGLLLVTGGSAALASVCTPSTCQVLHVPGTFNTPEDVEALIQRAADEHPEQEIAGLLHIGGASASSTSSSLVNPLATEALDESLRSLTLLVSGLVPRLKPGARVVTWSSDRAFASPSTWEKNGGGMASLAGAFMEQYTQALAHELRKSCTVYGLRISEEALRFALDPALDPEARGKLAKEMAALWSVPHTEAHGHIFPVGRPEVTYSTSSARGASVLGCSLDVAWALKDACKDAATYPVDGRPRTYKALAKALGTDPGRLVWAHGASDVILRTALAAAKRQDRQGSAKALMQGPSWPNAAYLLRSGGMQIDRVAYPDPYGSEASLFWQNLRDQMLRETPALVYLVHPHFPTGVKEPHFAARLRDLLESGDFSQTLVAVDQTYLGFTEKTEDDDLLETLAQVNNSVVLIRSLSKVEGLAGLRLGYAKSTAATAELISETLPFSGGLYISEMALTGKQPNPKDGVVTRCLHRRLDEKLGAVDETSAMKVLAFYQAEQAWLRKQVEELGFETFASAAPFFVLRGPKKALEAVVEDGAALQTFVFDGETDQERSPAVCLVADRASNLSTIRMLKSALEKTGLPGWAEMMKPMFG